MFPNDCCSTSDLRVSIWGGWQVMSNQEAVDCIKNVKYARSAAKHLAEEAVARRSSDDISVIVVKFQ